MNTRNLQIRPGTLIRFFLIITIVEGMAVLFLLFRVPSDVDNIFIAGYSLTRILMGGLVLLVVLLFAAALTRLGKIDLNKPSKWQQLTEWLRTDAPYFAIQTTLAALLVSLLSAVLFYLLPASQRFFPMVKEFSLYQPLGERAWALMIWCCLIIYKVMILMVINRQQGEAVKSDFLGRAAIVFWTIAAYLFMAFAAAFILHQSETAHNVLNLALTFSFLTLCISLWSFIKSKSK